MLNMSGLSIDRFGRKRLPGNSVHCDLIVMANGQAE